MYNSVEDPRFWMHDPEWCDLPIGTSGTIGEYGSRLCCLSRLLWKSRDCKSKFYWSPLQLNKWLAEHNGYHKGNQVLWAVLDDLKVIRFVQLKEHPRPVSDSELSDLFSWIESGQQVLLEVDFDPRLRSARLPHWLHADRVIEDPLCSDLQVLAYDPFYGKIVNVGNGRYVRNHKSVRNAIWRQARYEVIHDRGSEL